MEGEGVEEDDADSVLSSERPLENFSVSANIDNLQNRYADYLLSADYWVTGKYLPICLVICRYT